MLSYLNSSEVICAKIKKQSFSSSTSNVQSEVYLSGEEKRCRRHQKQNLDNVNSHRLEQR